MKVSLKLMGTRRDSSLLESCESCADAQSSPTPVMLHSPQSEVNAWNRDVEIREQFRTLQINTTPSMAGGRCWWMAAGLEHVGACGHWFSHAWDEQDRGSRDQNMFQVRISRLIDYIWHPAFSSIAFSLLLLATSILLVGLCTFNSIFF